MEGSVSGKFVMGCMIAHLPLLCLARAVIVAARLRFDGIRSGGNVSTPKSTIRAGQGLGNPELPNLAVCINCGSQSLHHEMQMDNIYANFGTKKVGR